MTVYVSTVCLANGSNVIEVLEAYDKAGLRNVELGTSRQYIEGLSLSKFKQHNFSFIVHHYFPPPREPFIVNLASQDATILARSKEQIKKSLEFCQGLGIELLSFHAGFRADPDDNLRFCQQHVASYEKAFATFVESLEEINGYAQERGVRIAIENNVLSDYNLVDGGNPFLLLCEAEEFERLWQRIPSANVGILLDLGHLRVTSHWLKFDRYQFIDRVKDKVFAIHVHENNGQVDEHRELDETSWCFEIISRKCFRGLPVVVESWGLNVDKVVQQVGLVERVLGKRQERPNHPPITSGCIQQSG